MKRTLMGTALAGAVIIGAGAGVGTFSDFSDTAASKNNVINTGTLKLGGNSTGDRALFDFSNLQPGDKRNGQEIRISNNGTLPGKLNFDLSSLALNAQNNPSDEDLKDIQITLSIQHNGKSHKVQLPASAFKSGNEEGLEKAINSIFNEAALQSGGEVVINGSLDFKRTADDQNSLQALSIIGDLSWTLTQAN